MGLPRELPDLKPKQPVELIVHRNTYRSDDLTPELLQYDSQVRRYNASRAGGTSDNDWVSHITDYYREGEKYNILAAARAQGFLTEQN